MLGADDVPVIQAGIAVTEPRKSETGGAFFVKRPVLSLLYPMVASVVTCLSCLRSKGPYVRMFLFAESLS